MRQQQQLLALLAGLLVACGDQPPEANADQPALPQAKPPISQVVTVRLDIEVGPQGEVLTARLAQGQADTLFAKAALKRVKQQKFPLRSAQQQPSSYWLLDHAVTAGNAQALAADTP